MKQYIKKIEYRKSNETTRFGYTLLISLFIGGILGLISAYFIADNHNLAITLYIENFAENIANGNISMPKLLTSSWAVLRWPLIICIIGVSSFCMLLIPVVFIMRGFFLAFCISAFIHLLGCAGFFLSLILFGVESLLCIPILFMIAMQIASRKEEKRRKMSFSMLQTLVMRNLIYISILFGCIIWETICVPVLLGCFGKFIL